MGLESGIGLGSLSFRGQGAQPSAWPVQTVQCRPPFPFHSSSADLEGEPRDGFGVGDTVRGRLTGGPPSGGGADGLALPVCPVRLGGPGSGWDGQCCVLELIIITSIPSMLWVPDPCQSCHLKMLPFCGLSFSVLDSPL